MYVHFIPAAYLASHIGYDAEYDHTISISVNMLCLCPLMVDAQQSHSDEYREFKWNMLHHLVHFSIFMMVCAFYTRWNEEISIKASYSQNRHDWKRHTIFVDF